MAKDKVRRQRNIKISSSTRESILNDYKYVQEQISEILSGKGGNYMISDPDYIHPSLFGTKNITLSYPLCRFQYYVKIRTALESALIYGSIPAKQLPARAPEYLEELAKR